MEDPPLVVAARSGSLADVRRLLAAGAPVDGRGRIGHTALIGAADSGSTPVVEALLAAGADPAVCDYQSLTALHHAPSAEIARLLLAVPGLLEAGASRGWTPLLAAVRSRFDEVVAVLLGHGADPHRRDRRGNSALHLAGTAELVRLLVAAGASPHAVNGDLQTPLHTAGPAAVGRELLTAGADLAVTDHSGRTALHTATDPELVEVLLAAGAPVDATDRWGTTPLGLRAHLLDERSVRAVEVLVAAGANPVRRNAGGYAPVHRGQRPSSISPDDPRRAADRARILGILDDATRRQGLSLARPIEPDRATGLPQTACVVHPGRAESVTATRDGVLVRWSLDAGTPRPVEAVPTDRPPFTVLAASADLLALGGGEDRPVELRRWERLAEVVAVFEEIPASATLSFSPDGRRLAVGWWEPGGGGLAVIDVVGRRVTAVGGGFHGAETVAYAPDGTLAVGWLDDVGVLELLRDDDLAEIDTFAGLRCRIEAMVFSADGRRLAVCGPGPDDANISDAEPGLVAVYDVATRSPLWTVTVDRTLTRPLSPYPRSARPTDVCFADGDRIVALGLRNGVLVFDASTGARVHGWAWPHDVRSIHPAPGAGGLLVTAHDGHHHLALPIA